MAEILLDTEAKTKSYYFSVMVNGKRVKRRGFKSKGEAKIAMANIVKQLSDKSYIAPSKSTFGNYFREWLDSRRNIADSTREMYNSYYKVHINPLLGHLSLTELSPTDIQKFVNKLIDKNLSDEMVKRIYNTVNASLNAAVTMEIISKNVANKISDKPKVKKQERQIWQNESMKSILIKSKGETRYWIAVFLAVMTGMRQGELLGLKWSDIDFDKSILHVRRNLKKDKIEFTDLKTESSKRNIKLSPLTKKALLEHKGLIDIEREYWGAEYIDENLVIPTSKGSPAKATKVLHAWKRLCEKYKPNGEPDITFHDLRHQSASLMLNDGIDIRIVSQRLGHSQISTTLNVYSHLLPNSQDGAALSLDRSMGFKFGMDDED